ncbi:MAG: DUF2752 domain-containing protein [Nitriliruptoraceae bacterium]
MADSEGAIGSPGGAQPGGSLTEPLIAAGVAAASVALVGLVYPRYPELFPSCPSRTLFGVWCPLCGGTRSAHALASGDLRAAVRLNAFLPVLVVLTAWSWLAWVSRGRGRWPLPAIPRWLWWTVGLAWLAYGVLRNLPVEPFTSWAP